MESTLWSDYSEFGIGLFAIMAPFATIPLLLSETAGFTAAQRRLAILTEIVAACIMLSLMVVLGEWLIVSLGTTIASFQIAGGLVIGLVGLSMMGTIVMPDTDSDGDGGRAFAHACRRCAAGASNDGRSGP
mgnify:CR=1 FL=1